MAQKCNDVKFMSIIVMKEATHIILASTIIPVADMGRRNSFSVSYLTNYNLVCKCITF